jgi:hypothetical protein
MRPGDGLSGVPMERVVIDGDHYVAKWLSYDIDWVARATGDTVCRPVVMWESGLYDDISAYVDPAVVGAARDTMTGQCVLLMEDVSGYLVDEGAARLPQDSHDAFVDAMAAMHVGMWGFTDDVGLCSPHDVYATFALNTVAREATRGPLTGVPALVPGGWDELHRLVPATASAALALATDPAPLVRALAETPQTLVHNDWKGGNLGLRPEGRTILLDWAFPGAGAGCGDLAWYLAVNCDRLPTSKEATISSYQKALQGRGIETGDWFGRQLELALVGAFVQLGWSKTGDARELGWWVDRVTAVAEDLLR